MPSTIKDLVEHVGLNINNIKTIKWGQKLECSYSGIYFISMSPKIDVIENVFPNAFFDDGQIKAWINKVKSIEIDRKPGINYTELKDRLNKFWITDENIIYIGQTNCKGGLEKRVGQYYNTELGENGPHAGGHWVKTLKNYTDLLFVHYICTNNPLTLEKEILKKFIKQVSFNSLQNIGDSLMPLPFANLEIDKSSRKQHGINRAVIRK
jgi:hypothetical protein